MEDISLFEAIHSQRSIRQFKPDPVSDEAITTVLAAATRAPSGGNRQPWRFIIIRDLEAKGLMGAWYQEAADELYYHRKADQGVASPPPPPPTPLALHMMEVPVLILVCMDMTTFGGNGPGPLTRGGSIYPAVQNLMLAARGLGLGTTLTILHARREEEVKAYFGIPAYVQTIALIPLGYPGEGEHFGPTTRMPVEKVSFSERWGA